MIRTLVLVLIAAALLSSPVEGAIVAGFNSSTLVGNDDGSTGAINLNAHGVGGGGGINFYGSNYTQVWANNNGNVTFTGPLGTFTPFGLTTTTNIPIIAAFFADVDTRPLASADLQYGGGTFNGRNAFGATWDGVGVGYYNQQVNKLNKFQLLLVDRSDIAAGDFDIVLNYNQIQWETGQASGGSNGLGGSSARIGYSNGSGTAGTFAELAGSGVNGAFLDSNNATGLIHNSLNSGVDGRYIFNVRNGLVQDAVPEPATMIVWSGLALGCAFAAYRRRKQTT